MNADPLRAKSNIVADFIPSPHANDAKNWHSNHPEKTRYAIDLR